MNSLTVHRKFREMDKETYQQAKKEQPRAWQRGVLKISKNQCKRAPELGLTFKEAVSMYKQLKDLGLPEDTKVSLLRYPDGQVLAHYPQKFGMGSFRI